MALSRLCSQRYWNQWAKPLPLASLTPASEVTLSAAGMGLSAAGREHVGTLWIGFTSSRRRWLYPITPSSPLGQSGGRNEPFLGTAHPTPNVKIGQVNCIKKLFSLRRLTQRLTSTLPALMLGKMNPTRGICLLTLLGQKKFLLLFR